DRRQHVLQIVRPLQRDLAERHDFAGGGLVPVSNLAGFDERTPFYFPFPAEPDFLPRGALRKPRRSRIISIEHREVAGRLVLKNPRFGIHVSLEIAVTVEMIGSDVEHHADLWVKAINRPQLKAGDLQNYPTVRRGFLHHGDSGSSDVAAHQSLDATRRNHLA